MSDLTQTVGTIFITQLTLQQAIELGLGPLQAAAQQLQQRLQSLWHRLSGGEQGAPGEEAQGAAGGEEVRLPVEEGASGGRSEALCQSLLPEFSGILDDYMVRLLILLSPSPFSFSAPPLPYPTRPFSCSFLLLCPSLPLPHLHRRCSITGQKRRCGEALTQCGSLARPHALAPGSHTR